MITQCLFGHGPEGQDVTKYRIENANGEFVELLNYGAAVHSVFVRDRDGRLDDVVLGGPTADTALIANGEGITIGRVANAIADARYTCGGRTYVLEKSGRFGGFMHGGRDNYGRKLFDAEPLDGQSVRMYLRDEGSVGFGCAADVYVTFTFDDSSRLSIEYDICPEGDTPICPTNHAYFNLSGGDVRDLFLRVYADKAAVMENHNVTDRRIDVAGTYRDFRTMSRIGDRAVLREEPDMRGRYNVFYDLGDRGFAKAAELLCRENGRRMEVYTDMPALILFTCCTGADMVPKYGKPYPEICAVCLETQYMPNAVNCSTYAKPFFKKGEHFVSKTVYAFSCE